MLYSLKRLYIPVMIVTLAVGTSSTYANITNEIQIYPQQANEAPTSDSDESVTKTADDTNTSLKQKKKHTIVGLPEKPGGD